MRIGAFLAGCLGVAAMLAGRAAPAREPAYRWEPELSLAGPVVMLVRLEAQDLSVYRNGVAIGWSRLSSGKPGHETPRGTFRILQKDADHRSNRYDDAPMPHMLRLTWDGVALHGGSLPGRPASHGCLRLPPAFAAALFPAVRLGDVVVVAGAGEGLDGPAGLVSPITPAGAMQPLPRLEDDGAYWDDFAQSTGVVSVVASIADRRVQVLRDGVRIAESSLRMDDALSFRATRVYRLEDDSGTWRVYSPTRADGAMQSFAHVEALASLQAGPQFTHRLVDAMQPGTTIVVTGESAEAHDPIGAFSDASPGGLPSAPVPGHAIAPGGGLRVVGRAGAGSVDGATGTGYRSDRATAERLGAAGQPGGAGAGGARRRLPP